MNEVLDIRNALIPSNSNIKCPVCSKIMKKVSWKITAGAFDAGQEVEQTVFQCSDDKNFISFEVSTGNPSEFASPDFYNEELDKLNP